MGTRQRKHNPNPPTCPVVRRRRPQRSALSVRLRMSSLCLTKLRFKNSKKLFNTIDQNSDGFVDSDDLKDMMASLGKNLPDKYFDDMVGEAHGPINFTMFLTMFGEKLNGTDPEEVIKNAFACFDEDSTGKINEDYLRELLTTMGDRFTDEQVDEMFREAPISQKTGDFDYVEFTRILKHGAKEP